MDLFFMAVLMCVAGAFNDRGRWSVFRDVCSLVLPQGLEGLGGLVSPHVSKNTLWDPIQRLKCAYLCVRLLQPGKLEAITGQQGCYGDQSCQRGATSVGCLFVETGFPFSVSRLSLSFFPPVSQCQGKTNAACFQGSCRSLSLSSLELSHICKQHTCILS